MFYPEASPWTTERITSTARNETNIRSSSSVDMDSRVNEKRKTIGLSATLGANILGGLIEVRGSVSYMNDMVREDNEVIQASTFII
jgi:hypothetical protein